MKLILAIINSDDAYAVNSHLVKAGFPVTKISSTGGFLTKGNTTFLTGVKDEDVETCIEIIGKHSKKRTQPMPVDLAYGQNVAPVTTEVTVGGATVFVLNVEQFRHL